MPLFELTYYTYWDDSEDDNYSDYDDSQKNIKINADNMDAAKKLAEEHLNKELNYIPNLSFIANRAYLDEVNEKAILKAAETKTPKLKQLDLNLMTVIDNYGASHPDIIPYDGKFYLIKLDGNYKAGIFTRRSSKGDLKFPNMCGDIHKPGTNCSQLEGIWEIIEE